MAIKAQRLTVAGLLGALTILMAVSTNADERPLTIVVHVLNDSDVSDKDLLLAQLEAARPYQAIGITMRWITGGADTDTYPPGIFHVRLHLLSDDRATEWHQKYNLNSDVLELAVSPARLVYVWCNRIRWSVTPPLRNLRPCSVASSRTNSATSCCHLSRGPPTRESCARTC
jgi:hypothetical protein